MNYILTENKTVLVGPMPWRTRFFQSELTDLEIDYKIPVIEGYTNINDELEIFPITSASAPIYDPIFESLSGPFYIFNNNEAAETYTKFDLDIADAKSNLKTIVAEYRYKQEISGTSILIQDINVTIDTARDNRNIFVQAYTIMTDTDTINWKFPEGWLTLNKMELGSVVLQGSNFIQAAFTAEQVMCDTIDLSISIEELKLINIPKNEMNTLMPPIGG